MRNAIVAAALASMALGTPDPAAIKIQGPDTPGNGMPPISILATQVSSATTAAGGALSITVPAAAGKVSYLTGFTFIANSGTAASNITITISNLAAGQSFVYSCLSPNTGQNSLVVSFATPLAGNGVNAAITVSTNAAGAGAPNESLSITGFQL